MLYEENTPDTLTAVEGSTAKVPSATAAAVANESAVANDTTKAPKERKAVLDTADFDRLHTQVYNAVKPETHGERQFLTRCLRTVLETDGQWTEEETMRVLNVLLQSREGVKVMFREEEFTNDGFPDYQVA